MLNHKQYVNDKILARSDWGDNRENVEKLLNNLNNVDISPSHGKTFEESTIGWLSASKFIVELIENNKDLTVENFKSLWKPKQIGTVISRAPDVIDETLLNKTYDLEYLLSISQEDDIEFDSSLLTEQGLRTYGLLDVNKTSLDAEEIVLSDASVPTVKFVDGKIISPFTGTEHIYRVDSHTYMDLDNGQIFKLKY